MVKRIPKEDPSVFYQRNATKFEEYLKQGRTYYTNSALALELVAEAREKLGYSTRTISIDIFRPLLRGYKTWKRKEEWESVGAVR